MLSAQRLNLAIQAGSDLNDLVKIATGFFVLEVRQNVSTELFDKSRNHHWSYLPLGERSLNLTQDRP